MDGLNIASLLFIFYLGVGAFERGEWFRMDRIVYISYYNESVESIASMCVFFYGCMCFLMAYNVNVAVF